MIYEISLEGNVEQAAAAGAAALRAEGEAAGQTLAELSKFRTAASAIDESTKATQSLVAALKDAQKASEARRPAFSSARPEDFKASKWEQPETGAAGGAGAPPKMPALPSGGAAKGAASGAAGASAFSSLAGTIGKATVALVAYGAAMAGLHSFSDLTRMAIGWRTMGQLQMLSFKASMDLRRAVSGVDAKPLVRAFTLLESNLSQTTVTGKALSEILTRGFNAFFGSVEKIAPLLSNAFQLGVLGALKLEGAWLDLRIAAVPLVAALGPFGDALGGLLGPLDSAAEGTTSWSATVKEIAGIADTAAGAIRTLTSAIEAYNKGTFAINVKQNLGLISADEGARQRNAKGAGGAGDSAVAYEDALKRKEARLAATATGQDIGDGIVQGMRASEASVFDGAKGLGKAATSGARAGADAHSPSRATERLGRDIDAGAVQGIRRDAGNVEDAADDALAPAVAPRKGAAGSAAAGGASSKGAGAGITIGQIGPFTFDVQASGAEAGDLRAKILALGPELAQEILRILSMRAGLPVMAAT